MLVCGSQNAMVTSNRARSVFVSRVNMKFIILFRGLPKLVDWKSTVLFNTKRIGSSSINRHV